MKKGDRVYHRIMEEYGTVDRADGGVVFVIFDRESPAVEAKQGQKARPAHRWTGEYDENWFRICPDMLVVTDSANKGFRRSRSV